MAARSKLKNVTDRLTLAAIYAIELYITFTILQDVLREVKPKQEKSDFRNPYKKLNFSSQDRKTCDILLKSKLTNDSTLKLKRNVELLYLQLYQGTAFQTNCLFKISRQTLAGVSELFSGRQCT